MNKKIQEKLNSLSQIKLSNDAKRRGFDILMQKLDEHNINLSSCKQNEKKLNLQVVGSLFKSKFIYGAAIGLLILVGGGYIRAQINNSLPHNESLYTVKRALEKAQITLSFSSEKKAQTIVGFLDKRAKEINKILEKSDESDENVVQKVEKAIETTKDDVENIKKYLDERDNNKIQDAAREKALEFQIVLENIAEKLPQEVEEKLKKELDNLNKELDDIIVKDKEEAEEANDNTNTEIEEDSQVIEGDFDNYTTKSTTTTSTLPVNLEEDGNDEKTVSVLDEEKKNSKDEEVQEEFSVEKDTFEVYIGR